MNRPTPLLLASSLGLWLGIHSLRAYLSMSVWNLADLMPVQLKSVLPTAIFGIAVLGYPAARLVGPERAFRVFGLGFAAAYALRQLSSDFDLATALASFAAFVLFLWWLPALLQLVAERGQRFTMLKACAAAICAQVAMQTTLHGLDVHALRGAGAYLLGLVLPLTFGAALLGAAREPAADALQPVSRGAIALMLWLFLELTLFANIGRVQEVTGLSLIPAALIIQLSLIAGVLMSTTEWRPARLISGLIVLFATVFAEAPGALGVVLLFFGHACAYLLLAGAFSRGQRARLVFAHGAVLIGAAIFFFAIFGYYANYEAPGFWPAFAFGLALLALGTGVNVPVEQRRAAGGLAAIALLGVLAALIPAGRVPRPEPGRLRVMSYNVHQGFGADGLPSAQNIAQTIVQEAPDLVALQEVGRGWNLLGGVDLVAYLRWRLADRHVLFIPTNGRLWGNAIISSVPLDQPQSWTFSANEEFRYGILLAEVDGLTFGSVHLSADLNERVDSIRTRQAEELIRRLPAQRTIIAGDFNALPNSAPIMTLMQRFVDVPFFFGFGHAPTWGADQRLDYVFSTPDLQASAARVVSSDASDHRPVVADFRK